MQQLDSQKLPQGYSYYRTHSKLYFEYILYCEGKNVSHVCENGQHAYIHHYFWGLFSIAFFEKTDIEPTRELLTKHSMKRGIIFWSGWKRSFPGGSGWISLGYIFSHLYHHSTRSAFSVLDTTEYWKKWSSNARGHRNKIQKEILKGAININTDATLEEFLDAYRKTKIHHKWKSYNIWRQKFLSKNNSANIRIYTASVDGVILAGAIFLDDAPTSTYLIAFQDDAGKKHHLGLAIIDAWFSASQKLGYQYLDLDHMKDILDPSSYIGYTKFKSEIADHEIFFHKLFMRFFL